MTLVDERYHLSLANDCLSANEVKLDNVFAEEMVDVVVCACAYKIASFECLKISS